MYLGHAQTCVTTNLYSLCTRYSNIETKEVARIGYNRRLFPAQMGKIYLPCKNNLSEVHDLFHIILAISSISG